MKHTHTFSRRNFIGGTVAATAMGTLFETSVVQAQQAVPVIPPKQYERKIKVGIVGGGHRGNLISGFMKKHGGYQIAAVCDYFPEVVKAMGEKFGVPENFRFSGLKGYKRMIESGAIEAMCVLDVPYFYPEQVSDAVDAGIHVYLAKPIAVDVPGTMLIGKKAKEATQKNVCVLVDYQLPLDPANAEIIKRIKEGGLGKLAHMSSTGKTGAWNDPEKGKDISSRFRHGVWLSDIALSGDTIVSYDIHIIDGIMAALGKAPVAAYGKSRIVRPNPHGDRVDTSQTIFEFDDGATWMHITQSMNNNASYSDLTSSFYGDKASAYISYFGLGKVFVRGGDKHHVAEVSKGIYNEGATANVAQFYANIVEKKFGNDTVPRAILGHLTCILGREASARGCRLTLDELMKENKKLMVDLTGLTV
ncbi:MAG: Gfo/Idh/MocA family oxidoreductase [bacterium]